MLILLYNILCLLHFVCLGPTFLVGVRQLGFERSRLLKDPKRDLAGHLADEPHLCDCVFCLCSGFYFIFVHDLNFRVVRC